MKSLVFFALLVSCSPPKPKYFADDKVVFKWSEQGVFWSKVCSNIAEIEDFHIGANPFGSDYVVYTIVVECQGYAGAIIYKRFAIMESQIMGVVE